MEERNLQLSLPDKIRTLFDENQISIYDWEEVRLRIHQPIQCLGRRKEEILYHKDGSIHLVTENELKEFLLNCSRYSLYAYEKDLNKGFLTVSGGHRIGVCGEMISDSGNVKNLKHIYFMNIRIAHTIYDCGKEIYPYLFENGELQNTLIISPPGYGKTTLLRDLIRLISSGDKEHKGYQISVIDERSEIAACYRGIPQNDVGMRTDICSGGGKKDSIERLIRSMAPEVIAVDELSGKRDLEAIVNAHYRGCHIIATAHGKNEQALQENPEFSHLFRQTIFSRSITIRRKDNGNFMFDVKDESGKLLFRED